MWKGTTNIEELLTTQRERVLAEQTLEDEEEQIPFSSIFARIEAKLAEWKKNKLFKNAQEEATLLNKEYDALREKYNTLKTETGAAKEAEEELTLFERRLNDTRH